MAVESTNPERCTVCQSPLSKSFTYQGYDYYRCRSCDHVTTLPFPTDAVISAHYAKQFQSGNYSLAHVNAAGRTSPNHQYLELLKSYFNRSAGESLRGKTILDIGCFTGQLLTLLEEDGAIVTGIELQTEAAKIAQSRIKGRVISASVFDADLPDKSFDVIVLSGVIEHVIDPRKLIQKSIQLLRPSGILLIETPNSGSILAKVFRKFWPCYQPVEHIHLFSHTSLRKLIQDSGATEVHFQNHWKHLQIDYVYKMFATFGPEFHALLKPLYKICPNFILKRALPFYGGEMLALYQLPKA